MKASCCIGFLAVLFLSFQGRAQIEHPRASPYSEVVQDIGLSRIRIAYSRPAARNRELFGSLVPFGRIWRVGANESTKFTTDTEVNILGNNLQPGTYALYAFPGEETWEVVFHRNTGHWGDGRTEYDPSEDAFRVLVKPGQETDWQENFGISFDSLTHNGAVMKWKWGYTVISIPLEVDTRRVMMEKISQSLEGQPSAQTYYEAARYFQEENLDPQRALAYAKKAIELGGDTYYFYRVKSLLEASLGDFPAAIDSAERSRELADTEGKDEFVRMNQENIKTWKKQLEKERDRQ